MLHGDFILIHFLLIHYLADFVLQTNDQAMNKGVGNKLFNKWLFYHVSTYTLIWFISLLSLQGIYGLSVTDCLIFSIITFISHYITDWITSRIGKVFWDKKDLHNGFAMVGIDQIFHYLQLYYTFKYVTS